MTFKPATWYPIAIVLSGLNLAAAGFAAGQAEPLHSAIHVAVAFALGVWAVRLRQAPGGSDYEARLEALEAELGILRQEISETQERLDFAERVLSQIPEPRRADPLR